jgi:hypothetical protein
MIFSAVADIKLICGTNRLAHTIRYFKSLLYPPDCCRPGCLGMGCSVIGRVFGSGMFWAGLISAGLFVVCCDVVLWPVVSRALWVWNVLDLRVVGLVVWDSVVAGSH